MEHKELFVSAVDTLERQYWNERLVRVKIAEMLGLNYSYIELPTELEDHMVQLLARDIYPPEKAQRHINDYLRSKRKSMIKPEYKTAGELWDYLMTMPRTIEEEETVTGEDWENFRATYGHLPFAEFVKKISSHDYK